MAAPCGTMASRPLLHIFSRLGNTAVRNTVFRPFSRSSSVSNEQTLVVNERTSSPWNLMAAVCVQRLPVISAEPSPVEQLFSRMMQQMEFERSLVSDHELRLLEDADRLQRKQSDDYDSDEEDGRRDRDIVLGQDIEDSWEQQLKKFQPAPRVRGDIDKDMTSVERCLAESLVLLAKQQVGGEKLWLLPQTQWQQGETLRQTAERALNSLPEADFKATFLGNAPCGVYKYKLPKTIRTEDSVGAKVFFFKAILADNGASAAQNASFMWVRKSELQRYVKPAYMMKVDRFILDL